jgi:hypothetical protein
LPGKATIRPSDEKLLSTKPPPSLAGVSEIACPLLYVQLLAHDDHVERGTFCSTEFAKESMAFSAQRTKIFPPENTGLQRNTFEGFSSILDTVGALANQRQKLRASSFLIVEYALDGETGGAATEPQIL